MQETKPRFNAKEFFRKYTPVLIIGTCIVAILVAVIISTAAPQPDNQQANNNNSNQSNGTVKPPEKDPLDDYILTPDTPTVNPVKKQEWQAPVKNYTIGMDYSDTEFTFSKTLKEWFIHKAIDFIVEDNAEVYAAYEGTVESIETTVMNGTKIVIVHDGGLRTVYSSLSENVPVSVHQKVYSGTLIGYATDSGYNEFAEGPHLHFEITKNNVNVDPRNYIQNL